MENVALSKALGEVLAACSLLSFLVVYQNITVHVTVHLPYDSSTASYIGLGRGSEVFCASIEKT